MTFTTTAANTIQEFLNNNEMGKELVTNLLNSKLAENPNMTEQEWETTKQQFMVFMFAEMLKANPELMKMYGEHIYNELRK